MESIKKVIRYLFLLSLLVFSSFEYFFRDSLLLNILCFTAICYIIVARIPLSFKPITYTIPILLPLIILIQGAFVNDNNIFGVIGQFIMLLGVMSIAVILKQHLVKVYTNIIVAIALYSTVIYIACLDPYIYNYLYEYVASNNSLGVEKAIWEGGGRNFIIYNFQYNFILDAVGINRNCGPFWEPGMFAVFLIIGLFFNIFISKRKIVGFSNLILLGALITTFSTGGFIVALFLFIYYIINKGITFTNVAIFIPITIIVVNIVMNLEYIGDKTLFQFENASVGSDLSRYGAFLTQIKMIDASPFIGGEQISNYTSTKTLASGTLLPFVTYGIPVGLVFYLALYNGITRLCIINRKSIIVGVELFILIIALSFSQTILLNVFVLLLMFNGLINKKNYYV